VPEDAQRRMNIENVCMLLFLFTGSAQAAADNSEEE
jgi:hypothetical protein